MTINEIKRELGIEVFNFVPQLDQQGQATDWFRHWNNISRTQVSVHKDVIKAIQEDTLNPNLSLKDEGTKQSNTTGQDYRSYILVKHTPTEGAVSL